MRMKVLQVSLILLFLSMFIYEGYSQSTPLIPSKTPTPVVSTMTTPTPGNRSSFEPFTQSDLGVLTGNVQRPNGAIWFNEQLYVACNGDWTLYEIDSVSGSTETFIYGVRNAHTLYVEDNGENAEINLWIPDFEANAFIFVNRSRAPQTVAANLQSPWGIASIGEDGFLITNLAGDNVMKITRGGETTVLIDSLRSPTGIVAEGAYVYVANNGSARRSVEWIERETLLSGGGEIRPLITGLQNTTGMVMSEDGYLYFAYAIGTRGVIGRIRPEDCREAGCGADQVEIVVYTELAAPLAGLTMSSDKRLFFHTIFRPEIYWVQFPG